MATSLNNIKSVDRNIIYEGKTILENFEIFDVNGTTYAPLRALCESTRKEVNWNANKNEVIIKNEEWKSPEFDNFIPNIKSTEAIPDAETAYKIANIMFENRKGKDYFFRAKGSVKDVKYDETYEAWVVYGEIVYDEPDPISMITTDAPIVVVMRKDNGEVIAFW